jgi:hypothetical protein
MDVAELQEKGPLAARAVGSGAHAARSIFYFCVCVFLKETKNIKKAAHAAVRDFLLSKTLKRNYLLRCVCCDPKQH